MNQNTLRRATLILIVTAASVAGLIAQTPRLAATNSQVRTVIDRIRMRTVSLQSEIDRARYDDTSNNADERISNNLTTIASSALNLRNSTSRYSNSNVDVSSELNTILERANRVNRIISRNTTSTRVTNSWSLLR